MQNPPPPPTRPCRAAFHALGVALLGLLLGLSPARAADPVQVMVLGTYHFGNPGLDLHNAKIDDVLVPRRQAELQAVADGLARFKPTQVAVEALADALPGRALPRYREFRAGTLAPDRNEIVQIGYRVAHQQGLAEVIGIDAAGDFPFGPLQQFAQAQGRADDLQRMVDAIGARTRAFEERARVSTIGRMLRSLNEPAAIAADHGWYLQTLVFGRGADQPAARLLGSWMARNAAICARLVQSVQPGDRVLVLYGAGHNHLLRQCVRDMPGWQLVEPNAFLPE
jgi:hypothetical protein